MQRAVAMCARTRCRTLAYKALHGPLECQSMSTKRVGSRSGMRAHCVPTQRVVPILHDAACYDALRLPPKL
eukprot:363926-Chlamydomonas_euryale.AAC.5